MNGHDYNCPLTVATEMDPASPAAFSAVTTDPARCVYCVVAHATRWECAEKTLEAVVNDAHKMSKIEIAEALTRACGFDPDAIRQM